jgi:hypothetical protein
MNVRLRYLSGLVVAAGLAMAAPPSAAAETFPLELKRLEASEDTSFTVDNWEIVLRYVNSQHFFAQIGGDANSAAVSDSAKEFAAIVKRQPEKYNAKHPMRDVAKLGSHKYAFVLDDKEPNSGKYDRLRFDKNRNGDLTDDELIEAAESHGQGLGRFRNSSFPRVEVTVDADGTALDYAFLFSVYVDASNKGMQYVSASLNAAAYREGDIALGGRKHHIVVVDFNSNGRFGDQARVDEELAGSDGQLFAALGDMLLVDPSTLTMGASFFEVTAGSMSHYLSKLVNVDGMFYEVSVSPAGDKITFSPSSLPMGQVTNPAGPFRAVVYGEHGFLKLSSDGTNPVQLPAGKWKLLSYTINRTGLANAKEDSKEKTAQKPEDKESDKKPKGSFLQALARAVTSGLVPKFSTSEAPRHTYITATATKDSPSIEVAQGATVPLPFGPPYKPVVKVGYAEGDGKIQLQMSLIGSVGEICSDMTVDGGRPGSPEFTITDPKGKVVESGSFEYG